MTEVKKTPNFTNGIYSYDIHTYWNKTSPIEKKFSIELREKLINDFKDDIEKGLIRVHKFWEEPIGPHPIVMWEVDFKTPEIFVKLVPWFQINHGKLSVLIHPRTDDGDLLDHTEYALWLGHKQRLLTEHLK